MLAPGTQIDRYELVTPIGEGGMANVWVARQRGKHGFQKLFALKVIQARFASDPVFRAMFLDEARIASAIEHPNVAQVFDLGEAGRQLYLVMEYVDGESVGSLMTAIATRQRKTATVPVPIAIKIAARMCAGLDAAHRLVDAHGNPRHVVHRDVSPQNVIVSVRGEVKLIDFGIALVKDRSSTQTAPSSPKGKLHYMAPEQAEQRNVGPHSDLFSVGATLYRMLSGAAPFEAGSDAGSLALLLSRVPPAPLPDSVPPLLSAIVFRALERDPGDRYATAAEMQRELEGALGRDDRIDNVANVAAWASANLSDSARSRRDELARVVASEPPTGGVAKTLASPTPRTATRDADGDEVPNLELDAPLPRAGGGPYPGLTSRGGPAPVGAPPEALAPAVGGGPYPGLPGGPAPIGGTAPRGPGLPPAGPMGTLPLPVSPVGPQGAARPGQAPNPALLAAPHLANVFAPTAPAFAGPGAPGASAQPPEGSLSEERSFIDIRAVAAARAAEARGEAAPPPPKPPAMRDGTEAKKEPAAPSAAVQLAEGGDKRTGAFKLAVTAIGVVLGIVVVVLLLPFLVRQRAISNARNAGVLLTIDRVGLGANGIALRGVTAKLVSVPSFAATIDEVTVGGFLTKNVRLTGADVTLDGPIDDVGPALALHVATNRPFLGGTPESPHHVTISSAHVTWTNPFGKGSRVTATDFGGEIDLKGVGADEARTSVGRLEVKTARGTLGPWSSSIDVGAERGRVRVMFDLAVPDGPSLLLIWGKETNTQLTFKVARTPLAHLGIRPTELGLPADPESELEVNITGERGPNGKVTGGGSLDLFRAHLPGIKSPVDVHAEGTASGMQGQALDLDKTTVTVGPFHLGVSGTIATHAKGARADLVWKLVPIPCERIARAEAKSWGTLAVVLQDIAHATGVARVVGTANASGTLVYDTAAPDEANVAWNVKETCGVSLFGTP